MLEVFLKRLPQTPRRFDDQTRREQSWDKNRQQIDTHTNKEGSAISHGALMLQVKRYLAGPRSLGAPSHYLLSLH